MLCPEVWNFPPPDTNNKESTGYIRKGDTQLPPPLNNFYFGHLVSLVVPDIQQLHTVTKTFTEDFDYYKVNEVLLHHLCTPEFISNFIKTGSLTALSVYTRIDIDNSVCITPDGVLVLVLDKKSFQESGLEGKVANCRKDRYTVQLNLKDEKFTKNTAWYMKIKRCFKDLPKFSLILSWEPPAENVCPSSIAKFLSDLDYDIEVCKPKFEIRQGQNVRMPVIDKQKETCSTEELVEWLGMFAINGDIDSGSFDSFTNTYECPENSVVVKDLVYLEWSGLFTVHQIERLYNSLINSLSSFVNVPWISLYVQGFSDAVVSWKLREHHFFTNGDNGYILFLEPSGQYLLYTKSSSNKKQYK